MKRIIITWFNGGRKHLVSQGRDLKRHIGLLRAHNQRLFYTFSRESETPRNNTGRSGCDPLFSPRDAGPPDTAGVKGHKGPVHRSIYAERRPSSAAGVDNAGHRGGRRPRHSHVASAMNIYAPASAPERRARGCPARIILSKLVNRQMNNMNM
ncbi:hypothetical protein EVAR_8308_1 [Eumeta japonica]|uniref:Uncharacterized protein n=1 Tax=Eumeta variegata TaxID=151549 RepID=A0A4C1VFM4_EUMVA|nr:hypothetical protein EVAR_8308_1 [Eumeta japonica]